MNKETPILPLTIRVRYSCGTYIATCAGKRGSCTMGASQAAALLAAKVFSSDLGKLILETQIDLSLLSRNTNAELWIARLKERPNPFQPIDCIVVERGYLFIASGKDVKATSAEGPLTAAKKWAGKVFAQTMGLNKAVSPIRASLVAGTENQYRCEVVA